MCTDKDTGLQGLKWVEGLGSRTSFPLPQMQRFERCPCSANILLTYLNPHSYPMLHTTASRDTKIKEN